MKSAAPITSISFWPALLLGLFLFILMGARPLEAVESEYQQGVTGNSAWFESQIGSTWVDVQTRRDGEGIVGYRMTSVGGNRFEYALPDLQPSETFDYRFIYQSGIGQAETPWFSATCDACEGEDGSGPGDGDDTPDNGSAAYEKGVSGNRAWFESEAGPSWVDVQTRRDGQGVVGYRMVLVDGDRFEYALPDLQPGETFDYRFIYQSGIGQAETPWFSATCEACEAEDGSGPGDGDDTPDNGSAAYEQGVSGVTAWFESAAAAAAGPSWVDVQTRRDDQGVVGYRMGSTGENRFEYALPDLQPGDLVEYRFIYQSGIGQLETPWFLYVYGSSADDDDPIEPVALLDLQPGMEMTVEFQNNTDGAFRDDEIYVTVIARNEAHRFCYLRPDGTLVEIGAGEHSDSWSYRLSEIDGFQIPKWAESGRLYLSMERPVEMTSIVEEATGQVGIIQPNLNDPNDPNQDIFFEWMEFTVQPGSFWGNTTQVDQYSFSYTLQLFEDSAGSFRAAQKVGIDANRDEVFEAYEDWVPEEFKALIDWPYRILAPAKGAFGRDGPYATYMDAYTDEVWNYYRWNRLSYVHPIWGAFEGRVLDDGRFEFRRTEDGSSHLIVRQPNTQELFECSGVLATGNAIELALQAQLCAALNRHVATDVSAWDDPSAYYSAAPSNDYAAFWHQVNLSGLAYGFSYDDVAERAPLIENHAPRGLVIDIRW